VPVLNLIGVGIMFTIPDYFELDVSPDECPTLDLWRGNYFTEMCSGSEAGSYARLIDCCITEL